MPLELKVPVHTDHNELSESSFDALKQQSLDARNLSYSPYSNFRVGACLLTESGQYIQGANVENASYGATICAERSAITRAIMMGHRKFKALAISTDLTTVASPCGICRQFIREFGPELPIYMVTDGGEWVKMYLNELLPLSFGPEDLGKHTG
ncbi:hypothetical protein BABINDRAFT_166574 [Babjeviella inositovora NRRL Y-12698]|uniref:Cytidine deaminase n=1 Tax=Babjeviella inositovora NRRL Y-12698 TaxID=984486 RepID=A0A1E3QRU1_9ASCO|nr:uncharacterized protein BABINDRAFT_166574 [Babjeviella inositovora NRRL Y-12698]ODQ80214.1 hypothetical protein BABINDRAFT_166574 [Babjeviella inositovora NRRL Y-12698]